MTTSMHQSSDFLPLPRHRALLTALLAPGPEAYPAALQWLETVDFDKIDLSEQRLMPFFDSRLRELVIDHPNQGRVRGLYRRAWYLEQMRRHQLGKILEILEGAQTTPVLLKGAAISCLVYNNPVHRPYDDFDILVPYEQQPRALSALGRAGGIVKSKALHAVTVKMPSGLSVDLHRSPYHMAFSANCVDPLFTRVRKVQNTQSRIANISSGVLLTLGNSDQLLHAIMHGLCSGRPSLRWIVDAVLLVRQERGMIDWDLFQSEAARLALIEPSIIGLREILSHEPDSDAVRALAHLERKKSPSAVERWLQDGRVPGIITLWDVTSNDARGPVRLALVANYLVELHGIWGLARLTANKGLPYWRKLFGVFNERLRRRIKREND